VALMLNLKGNLYIKWCLNNMLVFGNLQVVGVAKSGDVVGEIGVLCYRPQIFTVRTRSLCQLLRMNRTSFLSIVQSNVGDGTIIMNNLIQVYYPYYLSLLSFLKLHIYRDN
jgi:hypothetical protein